MHHYQDPSGLQHLPTHLTKITCVSLREMATDQRCRPITFPTYPPPIEVLASRHLMDIIYDLMAVDSGSTLSCQWGNHTHPRVCNNSLQQHHLTKENHQGTIALAQCVARVVPIAYSWSCSPNHLDALANYEHTCTDTPTPKCW